MAGFTAAACLLIAVALAPVSSADVTIGPNVNQTPLTSGTCGFATPAERPCTFITSTVPGQTMNSPCDGTITRFRLNGFPKPNNRYRLRVVRRNADGSFTGTASSAQVTIGSEGVNEYATSLPISSGEQIGIDFQDSTEEFGLRWVGGTPGVGAAYFYAFPADGGSAFPSGPATFYYLFNADIVCGSPTPIPVPVPPPSNEFKIVSLKGTTLTLSLGSKGVVAIADGSAKPKKAKAASASKAKPKLLKPSSASGGPGLATVKLKLTGTAKKTLKEKDKVKVKAKITFTPTGGTASTQVKPLTVKKPKHAKQ